MSWARRFKPQPCLQAVLVLSVPLSLYLWTLARTVYTFDSGELTVAVSRLGLVHAPGYPLYLLLAKAFTLVPIGSLAFRVNLMSAVFASLAIAEVYRIVARLTQTRWAGIASGWLLAASPVFWSQAIVASTYPLHIFLMMSMVLVILHWLTTDNVRWLFALALLYGLSLANHLSTTLLLPGIVALLCMQRRHLPTNIKSLATIILLLMLGCALYLYLPIRYLADTTNYVREYFDVNLATWRGMWWMVTGEMFRPEMFGYSLHAVPAELLKYAAQLWINTLGIGFIVGLVGFTQFFRKGGVYPALGLLTVLWLSANVAFYANYRAVNKQTMFVFSYAVWAIPTGVGFAYIEELMVEFIHKWTGAPSPSFARFVGAILLVPALTTAAANLPARDLSRRADIADYARAVLQCARPNALILAGWLSAGPLEYYQAVEGQRRDVTILNTSFYALGVRDQAYRSGRGQEFAAIIRERFQTILDEAVRSRPVYVLEPAEYELPDFLIVDESPCYRIVQAP